MCRAALGTVAVHTLIAIAFVLIGGRDVEPPAGPEASISLVDVASTAPTSITPAPPSLAATSGGGSPASAATAPVHHVAAAPHLLHGDRVSDVLGTAAVDIDPGGGTGDDGDGGGHGHGRGIGDGDGLGATGHVDPPPPPPAPPPPKISKARPPRLIFPKKSRDVDVDTQAFIAAVVVDEDGYVVGAHLVRGFGPPYDDQAASLVFRFRYEPALDDDGHPITARIQQAFLVE